MKPSISSLLMLTVSTVGATLILAGCGVSGSSSAASLGDGGHVKATTKSIAKTSSSEVLDATLKWLSSQTSLTVAAPAVLPNPPSGYWAAQAQGTAQEYQITLWDVTHPLEINSPHIIEDTMPNSPTAAFGVMELSSGMPAPGAPGYLTPLQQHNSSWLTLSPTNGTPVALGSDVTGFRYSAVQGTVVDWGLGSWTLQVSGGSSVQELQAAKFVDSYLANHRLPPAPGIVAIHLTRNGAKTLLDWINGRQLSWVEYASNSGNNAVTACTMAISWKVGR